MTLKVVPPPPEDGDPGSFAALDEFDAQTAPVRQRLLGKNDQALADAVIAHMTAKNGVSPVFDEEQLWQYDGFGVWEVVDPVIVRNLLGSWDGTPIVNLAGAQVCDKKGNPIFFEMSQSQSRAVTDRVCDMSHRPRFFAEPKTGVMFSDCFMAVTEQGDIIRQDPSPEHRCKFRISAPYPSNPYALPEMYIDAMFRAFGSDDPDALDKIAIIQEWSGLAMIGKATNGRAMFLVGPERSGKSVTAKVLLGVFPESARMSMSLKSLDPTGVNANSSSYFLAQIANARINADLDIPGNMFVGGENFKKLVTGEGMMGRHPGGKPFAFTPKVAMLFAGESLPRPEDTNRGFFRRWLVIRFLRQLPEADAIQNYEAKILAAEFPIIAAWFIRGAAESIKRGNFNIPDAVRAENNAWISDADPLVQFRDQHLVASPSMPVQAWLSTDALFDKFGVWAKKQGYKDRNIITFGKGLAGVLDSSLCHRDRNKKAFWGYRYEENPNRADDVDFG